MNKVLFLVILSFVLCNCSSVNQNKIDEVDVLQKKLNALEFSYNNIDTLAVEGALKRYKENLSMIKKYYNDTVDKDFVYLINKYKGIKKAGKSLSKKDRRDISTNIKITKHQLNTLSIDLESDVIPADSIDYFIKVEGDKINKLNGHISNYILICDEVIQLDTTLSSKVQKLLNKN